MKIIIEKIKENIFLGKFAQMYEPIHPSQGFCEIWAKKGDFQVDLYFGPVWESVSPQTKRVFLGPSLTKKK